MADSQQSLTDVETRLLVLEANLEDCKAGFEDTTTGLEVAKTEHEALAVRVSAVETGHEASGTELDALADKTNALQETIEAPFTCQSEMTKAYSTCIDSSPNNGTFWQSANQYCLEHGGHICTASEYLAGCFHFVKDEGPMMTGELLADGQVVTVDIADDTGCAMFPGTTTLGTLDVPYRCCRDLGLDWAKEQ